LLTYQEKKQIEADIVKIVSVMLTKMEEPLKKAILTDIRKELKSDIRVEVGPMVTAKVKEEHAKLSKEVKNLLKESLKEISDKLEYRPENGKSTSKKTKLYTT
jgi:hypothetical protein